MPAATPHRTRLTIEPLEDRTTPAVALATGAAAGQLPEVRLYDETGRELNRFLAYDAGFTGGVSVAVGRDTVKGRDVVITGAGAGAGGGPHVKVFDSGTGELLGEFFAYDPTFTGGVNVATGDLGTNGAGIVTGAGAGGGPHVKLYDWLGNEGQSFYAYDPEFRGGVNVAVSSKRFSTLNGFLHYGAVITGAGPGGGPHVKWIDPDTLTEWKSFFAYDPTFLGGVSVAAFEGGDIITGAGAGGAPYVKVFDVFVAGDTPRDSFDFFAGAQSATHGVEVASAIVGPLRFAVLTLTPKADGRSEVKLFRGGGANNEEPFAAGTDWGIVGSISGVSPPTLSR